MGDHPKINGKIGKKFPNRGEGGPRFGKNSHIFPGFFWTTSLNIFIICIIICVKDCSESSWLATPLCTGFPTFNIPFQRLKNSTEPPVSPIMAWLWKDSPKVRECSNSCHFVQKAKKQAGAHPSCEADVNASKLWTMVAANSLWLALCLQQPASNLGNLQFLSSNMNILGTNAKNSFLQILIRK